MENIDFLEAKVLLTVIEEKSVSAATKKLTLSQPAISKLIMRIEQNYNIIIFDKNKRPWQLTPAGLVFEEFLNTIVKEHARLLKNLSDVVKDKKGQVVFYTMIYEDKYLLPDILAKFYEQYPNFKVNISIGETKAMEDFLLEKKADFATVVMPVKNNKIKTVSIKEHELIIGIPNQYLIEKNLKIPENKNLLPDINLSLFKDKPFILHKKKYKVRDIQEGVLKEKGISIGENIMEIEQHITGLSLAKKGLGVCFLLKDVLKRAEKTDNLGNISFFRIEGIRPKQVVAIGYLKNRILSDIEKDFLKIAKEKAD